MLTGEPVQILHGDNLDIMRAMRDKCVDLVVTSPPYEDARQYAELQFRLRGQAWVDWAVPRYLECLRVCRGLVAWVIEGKTRKYRWSATPALFMADLHRAGVHLRKPPIFKRVGIPGSGGPDWWRNDYEIVVCATRGGRLPWSCNTATGRPPKYAPGGAPSHRMANGRRVAVMHTKTMADGSKRKQGYNPPAIANPGNVIECQVGGGRMGSPIAHENEAPFPESLVEPFVLCYCPPGGVVLDPFSGSGTTAKVAMKHGRRAIAIDERVCQIECTTRRVQEVGQVA